MAMPMSVPHRRSQPPSRWLTSALQAFPDLLTIVDSSGFIDYVSASVQDLLGHRADMIIGHRACEFLPDEDLRNAAGWLRYATEHSDAPQLVHRLARRDGTFVWFESSLRQLPADGTGTRVMVVSRDISARRIAERDLTAFGRLWRDIADLLDEGVLILDHDGSVVSANDSAGHLLGVAPQALTGADVRHLLRITAVDRTGAAASPAALLATSTPRDLSVSVPAADGTIRLLHGRIVPLPDHDESGAPGRIAMLLRSAEPAGVHHTELIGTPREQANALRQVLSPREIEVLRLLAEGLDVRGVSTELGISIHTTRNYVKSVLHKLDARTQLQAVVIGLRAGLVELS